MPEKRLSTLLAAAEGTLHGAGDPPVRGLRYDSREVRPGELFAALPGLHVDGHNYLRDAVDRGAVAVMVDRGHVETAAGLGVPVVAVEQPRRALSAVAAAFYDHPSRDLRVIGVTGTDGKSSTVSFIEQLLSATGHPAGLVSTVSLKTADAPRGNEARQSTPEAPHLHGYLAEMRDAGKEFAVVEATSHGLSPRTSRLADVCFRTAVFTNLSHEHLEFHGSFEQYRRDKSELFRALDAAPGDAFGVVNAADANTAYFEEATKRPVLRYASIGSADGGGPAEHEPAEREQTVGDAARLDLVATDIEAGPESITFSVVVPGVSSRPVYLPMPGEFQVDNVLAALLTVSQATARPALELAEHVPHLTPLEGRLFPVGRNLPFSVVVDYAHTPASYEKLFPMMRRTTSGRIIAVFGSAGERDVEKRALQGATAARHCELVVLCDEDPRGEDRLRILRDIEHGIRSAEGADYLIVPDRREAIRAAVDRAQPGDTVLLLGKGHEKSIIYADGPRPWNEAEVAAEVLAEAGYDIPLPEVAG
ncbi:MAG: Mur ligase family protein [Spirochaetaceae bacterium]